MVVVDHFNGGQVVVQLPPGGGTLDGRPNTLLLNVSNVTRQEGLPVDPNPHRIISLSLWFSPLNIFVPVALFTDDVAAQEYGKDLMEGTTVYTEGRSFQNFFVYPRPSGRIHLAPRIDMTFTESACTPVLTVSLRPKPEDIIHFSSETTLELPPLALEFRGFSEPFEEKEVTKIPIGTTHKMTQITSSRPAWVKLSMPNWIMNPHNPLKFMGILYESGTREFTLPPTLEISSSSPLPRPPYP